MKANSDDDDIDGIKDNIDEPIENAEWDPPVTMDDDLVKYTIEYAPVIPDGTITLTVSADTYYPYTLPLIVVWKDPAKKERLIPPVDSTSRQITWTVGVDDIPHEVWVEGLSYSKEMIDCSIKIDYNNSLKNCNDEVGNTIFDINFMKPGVDGTLEVADLYTEISNPAPIVTINPIDMNSAYVDIEGNIHVYITGKVEDSLQNIVTDSQADIKEVTMYANELEVTQLSLTKHIGQSSYFEPYSSYNEFAADIQFPSANPFDDDSDVIENVIRVEAKNLVGNLGYMVAFIYIRQQVIQPILSIENVSNNAKISNSLSVFNIEDIILGAQSVPGKYAPLLVEVNGPAEIFQSNNLKIDTFGKSWDIVKVQYSPEHYLLGEWREPNQSNKHDVIVVVEDLPKGVKIESIKTPVEVLGKANELNANLKDQNNKLIGNTRTKSYICEIMYGHKSVSEANCPKLNEDIDIYCALKWLSPENAIKYYYSDNDNGNYKLNFWDRKSYWYSFENSIKGKNGKVTKTTYSWVDDNKTQIEIIPFNMKGCKIEYEWYLISPERAPLIKRPGGKEEHSGINLKYTVTNKIPNWTKWKVNTPVQAEGTFFVYAKLKITLPGFTISTLEFPSGTILDPKTAEDRIQYAHKIICGDYVGAKRTFEEWARTHLNLPYGLGAKDKYINEDCSGLVAACALASGAIKKEDLGIWSAAAMAGNAAGENGDNYPKPGTFTFVPLLDGTIPKKPIHCDTVEEFKSEIGKRDIRTGDLIAHRKSWGIYVGHIVIVLDGNRSPDGKTLIRLGVIEAQGYDDRSDAGRINVYHSSAEKTVYHDYITEYVERKDTDSGKPYLGDVYIIRIKK